MLRGATVNLFGAKSAATLALAVAVLGACSSTNGKGSGGNSRPTSSSSPPVSSVATAPASSVASSAPPASSVGTSATAPAHPDWCTAAQLVVAGGPQPGGSAAGHTGVLLTFTNHSSAKCVLYGYPGVAGLDAGGSQIGQAARTYNGYLAGCRCSSLLRVHRAPGRAGLERVRLTSRPVGYATGAVSG